MSLSHEDGFAAQAWDTSSSFLDQPIDLLDGDIDEWLPSSWSDLLSSPGSSMENPTIDIILPESESFAPREKTQEGSIQPHAVYRQDEMMKQPVKRKGRPKLGSKNEFSAKEVTWPSSASGHFPSRF